MNARPGLGQLGLSAGKKARLHHILYQHGLRNGTALFLPYDQGLEHGPRDFFANPAASDPKYIIGLALEGGFNGIAIQIGLAEKFYWDYAGEVPLVLKLNGKTDIASGVGPLDRQGCVGMTGVQTCALPIYGIAIQIGLAEKFYWDYAGEVPLVLKLNGKTDIASGIDPLSPVNATVQDAVRLGADAVGYTLYVGSPAAERDFGQYRQVREEALRLGMPLIVWAYQIGR